MPVFRLNVRSITTTTCHYNIEAETFEAAKAVWESEPTNFKPVDIDVSDKTETDWEYNQLVDDELTNICRNACDDAEVDHIWVVFIADLVNGTNGAYAGSSGAFNTNTAIEYADKLAAAIGYRLVEGQDETEIRKLDFITLYNTEMGE